jgi:hypothetical protein
LQASFKIAASSKKMQAGLARKESHKSEVLIDTSRPAYPAFFESPNEFGRASQCHSKCTLNPPFVTTCHKKPYISRGASPFGELQDDYCSF